MRTRVDELLERGIPFGGLVLGLEDLLLDLRDLTLLDAVY